MLDTGAAPTQTLTAIGSRVDADLCSACGNQFPPGQVCNRCKPPRPRRRIRPGYAAAWVAVAIELAVFAAVLRFDWLIFHG